VILALDGLAVEPACGKWNAAVGAQVAYGKDAAIALAAHQQWNAQQQQGSASALVQPFGAHGGVPLAKNQFRGGLGTGINPVVP